MKMETVSLTKSKFLSPNPNSNPNISIFLSPNLNPNIYLKIWLNPSSRDKLLTL
jgi:hypothetical protein